MSPSPTKPKGFLLINKPRGSTSFSLVRTLRRRLDVKKVGHAGTLDPFATGVMILLVGRDYTRLSDKFLTQDKEYIAKLHLGITTDSFDCDGAITEENDSVPTKEAVEEAITHFQGTVEQVPPMFSAKKVNGKKLYELARKGVEIERKAVSVEMKTKLLSYEYPYMEIKVSCSKGTYIRSIADDLGKKLGCGAHLCELTRTKAGSYTIEQCLDGSLLEDPNTDVAAHLREVPCASSNH